MEGVILEAETGDFLGKHHGFWFYTIGQRQGLRLPGGPWYLFSHSSSITALQHHTRVGDLSVIISTDQCVFCWPVLVY